MNDRELLELAAKAIGVKILSFQHGKLNVTSDNKTNFHWNPLTDEGDALRLAVKLKIKLAYIWDGENDQYDTVAAIKGIVMCEEQIGILPDGTEFDELAATRRAIVRSAAEIGRSMK